jgi:hypothetical protein
MTAGTLAHARAHLLRVPLLVPVAWGLVFGGIQAASPVAIWWLDASTVLAASLAFIPAVYVGFAVADGRPRVVVVECIVAGAFLLVALVSVTASAWFLVAGFTAHGLKDLWQERTHYVANTRWWPPFCATVDFLVALIIALELAAGVAFHN